MAEYFTYGQFVSCTSLVDFQQSQSAHHKINLAWILPATEAYKYDRVEIYRYIGDHMACVNPNDITEASIGSKLIYTAKQNITETGGPNGTVALTTYFPSTVTSTLNTNLTAVESFIDVFSTLLSTSYDLDAFHSLPGVYNNQTVINDIGFTRRALYYILKTYIKGVTDSAPYLLTPDNVTGKFANHSSKSQVRHDYLHYEGDEIWCAQELNTIDPGISRTAVDINRLYLDATQSGPTGRGGYAWVSDRGTNRIFQHNLKDGYTAKIWSLPYTTPPARGFGIGIDGQTGDCIAGPGGLWNPGYHPIIYRCKISNGTQTQLTTLPDNGCAYGIIPLFNNPDKMLITDFNNYGPAQIFNLSNNTTTPCGVTFGYAAAACPNGMGVQRPWWVDAYGPPHVSLINPTSYTFFNFNLIAGSITATGTKIGIDQYNAYPNTIINKDMGTTNARECFSIWASTEWGVTVPTTATLASQCTINWGLNWVAPLQSQQTAGFDGENNAWILNSAGNGLTSSTGKTKLYRTSHDRDPDDAIDDSIVFPYGGESRYPAVQLKEWPFTFTNTREIEWFLTRNHGVSTLNVSTLTTQESLDVSTLDNKLIVNNWWPGLSATAHDAWWSLVEEKMLRKHYNDGTYLTTNYFKVYDTTGSLDGNTKKWGIRMQLSDIQTELGAPYNTMNRDLFYETQATAGANWQSHIIARIRAWSDAFASDTSYGGNRSDLVTGNIKGIKVHPHYSQAAIAVNNYYVNPSLSTTQKALLETYAKSPKYINLRNLVVTYLYMYSDFTGNILVGSLDSSPLNRDIIHPEPENPVLLLSVSGYQSNLGYQDTPAYCYPWKNTIPVSMSALYNDITGYDDFNVTYLVSSNMGSYLLTSFSLSTDDYWPSYLTDITKIDIITTTTNTSYLSTNIYNNNVNFGYTYYSPSMNGLSGNRHPAYDYPSGKFNPKVNTVVKDLYDYDTINRCRVLNVSADATVAVLERWPEPKFYVNASDSTPVRQGQFCSKTWGLDRFNKTASILKESNTTDAKRYDTTYGVDPISAVIQDRSIARTWPISGWDMTIATDNQRLGWTTKSFIVISNGSLNVRQDEQNQFDTISAMPFRYGNYTLTMNVMANTTSTSSDKLFTQYIKVAEFEPFANFWAISASTVSSNFSATNASISAQLTNVSPIHNGVSYPYVSGYAPNLTVYFQDSSEAHTFPISAYHWNFGDPFNEGPEDITDINSNYYTVTTDQVSGGFNDYPVCWNTKVQSHTAVHTYIMPGTYDVTLTVNASCTNTADVCARYVDDSQHFYVYVEEIPPQCNDSVYGSLLPTTGFTKTASGINGGSPLTAYFMASSIIAGSFPIGRMDWDFGDGTVQRITRYPLTQTTTQGLSVVNISAYSYDLTDPRNIVVPHVFVNQTELDQTLSITVSAYAANTNTMIVCNRTDLVSPLSAEINQPTIDTKKLIGSRFDDNGNLVYIVEGQNENTTYTIALSGELN